MRLPGAVGKAKRALEVVKLESDSSSSLSVYEVGGPASDCLCVVLQSAYMAQLQTMKRRHTLLPRERELLEEGMSKKAIERRLQDRA